MGTSKGYLPPNGYLWSDAKRSVTFMKRNGFSSNSIGKSISNFSKAWNNNQQRNSRAISSIGAKAVGFIGLVKGFGLDEALKFSGLNHLSGLPFDEVYVGLMDYFSENNNTFEDSIANETLQECMKDLFEGVTNNEEFEHILLELDTNKFLIDFFSKYMETAFFSNFKEKINALCSNIEESIRVQRSISNFIKFHIEDNYEVKNLLEIDWRGSQGSTFIGEQLDHIWSIFELWRENK